MKTQITAFFMLTAFAAPAFAQETDHGHHAGPMADHMAAMDTMMESMAGMESSGNADADFLLSSC